MKTLWGAMIAVTVFACGGGDGRGLGSRVAFDIFQLPYLLEGVAGGCTRKGVLTLSDAQALKWATGAALEVHPYWPERTDCTGSWNPVCPNTVAQIGVINSSVWDVESRLSGSVVTMTALKAGDGGFRVTADGAVFTPEFMLTVDDPVSMSFEAATGPTYDDLIPGPIT